MADFRLNRRVLGRATQQDAIRWRHRVTRLTVEPAPEQAFTFDPLAKHPDVVLSNNDLTAAVASASDAGSQVAFTGDGYVVGTATDKIYFEVVYNVVSTNGAQSVGFTESDQYLAVSIGARFDDEGIGLNKTGNVRSNNTSLENFGAVWADADDVIGCALDFGAGDYGNIWWHVNGEWVDGDPNTPTGGTALIVASNGLTLKPAVTPGEFSDSSSEFTIAAVLAYTIPTGYSLHTDD